MGRLAPSETWSPGIQEPSSSLATINALYISNCIAWDLEKFGREVTDRDLTTLSTQNRLCRARNKYLLVNKISKVIRKLNVGKAQNETVTINNS